MRDLINEDMFLLSEIIEQMDFKLPDFFKETVIDGKTQTVRKGESEYMMEIVNQITPRLHRAKVPVNQLLCRVLDKDMSEIQKMPIKTTIKTMIDLFTKDEVNGFFK